MFQWCVELRGILSLSVLILQIEAEQKLSPRDWVRAVPGSGSGAGAKGVWKLSRLSSFVRNLASSKTQVYITVYNS